MGTARMVDVSQKDITERRAVARAEVRMSPETARAVRDGSGPKGDVVGTARIAGIAGAKRTADVLPLCHPLGLDGVEVELVVEEDRVVIEATARTTARTGVEMEALTAASVAALCVYDMVKGLERGVEIASVRLEEKTGGKSGAWRRTA